MKSVNETRDERIAQRICNRRQRFAQWPKLDSIASAILYLKIKSKSGDTQSREIKKMDRTERTKRRIMKREKKVRLLCIEILEKRIDWHISRCLKGLVGQARLDSAFELTDALKDEVIAAIESDP